MDSKILGMLILLGLFVGLGCCLRNSLGASRQVAKAAPVSTHAGFLKKIMNMAAGDADAFIRIVSRLRDTGMLHRIDARGGLADHGAILRAIDNLAVDKLEELAGEGLPTDREVAAEDVDGFKSSMAFYSGEGRAASA